MEFHGTIKKGKLTMPDIQNELRRQYLISLKEGQAVKEILTKETCSKSYQQVKTIFGYLIARILQYFDDNGWDNSILLNIGKPTGVRANKTLLKEYFYAVCPMEDEEGKRITLSNANIEQAMDFIDNIMNYAASQWGCHIPEPNPHWRNIKED